MKYTYEKQITGRTDRTASVNSRIFSQVDFAFKLDNNSS